MEGKNFTFICCQNLFTQLGHLKVITTNCLYQVKVSTTNCLYEAPICNLEIMVNNMIQRVKLHVCCKNLQNSKQSQCLEYVLNEINQHFRPYSNLIGFQVLSTSSGPPVKSTSAVHFSTHQYFQ